MATDLWKKFSSLFIFYPFVLAVFPILSLHLGNFSQVDLMEVFPFVIASLVAQTLLWFAGNSFIKSNRKTALILSGAWILFFSSGQLLPSLSSFAANWLGVDFRQEVLVHFIYWLKVSFSISLSILFLVVYLTLKSQSELKVVTLFMNASASVLLAIVVLQYLVAALSHSGVIHEFESEFSDRDLTREINIASKTPACQNGAPDIFYLILDGYGRSDILQRYYHFDNKELLGFLEASGFYLAEESHSNYSVTVLSLASSLNMAYLDDEIGEKARMTNDPYPLFRLIQSNRLFEFLSMHGYRIVAFASGYRLTEINSADLFLAPVKSFTQFQNELINLTPLPLWLLDEQNAAHRRRIRFIFDRLPDASAGERPSFVFAHIPAPHPPFVFGADGEAVSFDIRFITDDGDRLTTIIGLENYQKAYISQVSYLNRLLMDTIQKIQSSARRPLIIIIQGDHGPGSMLDWESVENSNVPERMSILNAYYFSDRRYRALYPEITPVNTFRVILDQYFCTRLGLLEDKSYFSLLNSLYGFIDVSERVSHPDLGDEFSSSSP